MAEVNLLEIYIANGMGLLLMIGILVGSAFKMQKKAEANMLYFMAVVLIVCCIIDPVVFTLDGKPGTPVKLILYFGNFILYLSNLIFSPAFLLLIERKSRGTNSKILISTIAIMDTIFFIILCINFFKPIIFYVDEANRYQRLPLFFWYTALGMFYTVVALFIYVIARIKGGVLKAFPAIELVTPIFLGLLVQGRFYGISTIWPATAVGLTLMVLAMQNRNIMLDSMTGLYNRKYLDSFNPSEKKYCMMMLDLNGFKAINDTYGHSEGDAALTKAAELMLATVGSKGTAVRYAGDEFIILLNTDNPNVATDCIYRLKKNFEDYYLSGNKPYKLTFSLGWGIFDFSSTPKDLVLKTLDDRMYEDKREYYKTNDRRKR